MRANTFELAFERYQVRQRFKGEDFVTGSLSMESSCSLFRIRGPGIAQDMHEHIFERFGRAHSASHISGFGLGLFIARNLAEAQGGRLLLESSSGEGAKFIVELPCLKRS